MPLMWRERLAHKQGLGASAEANHTRVGLARSTLYEMIASGDFPKPILLGKRAVGWREVDIEKWIESRKSTLV